MCIRDRLNRRGYNTFAACESCGKVMTCPNCSISQMCIRDSVGTVYYLYDGRVLYEVRESDWSSDVCSSDLITFPQLSHAANVL